MESLNDFILQKKNEIKEIKGNKRWIKQSDINKYKDEEIHTFYEKQLKKQKIEEYEKLKELCENLDKKNKNENNEDEELNKEIPLNNKQIIRKLRQLKEPIRLFGETDLQRYNRLKELKINKNELKKNEQNIFRDVLRGKIKENSFELIDVDNVENKEKKDKPICSDNEENKKEITENNKTLSKEDIIYNWIKITMKEWNEEIENIEDENTKKLKQATYLQTHKDLKPLEKKLKKKKLEIDILDKMYNIIDACQKRNFKAAHDAYMLLAIGNAAWTMGVTMVGIHERAGRSKIFTSEVAHILNDETTRKYIQMIKRLLSFCQRKYCTDSTAVKISTIHV